MTEDNKRTAIIEAATSFISADPQVNPLLKTQPNPQEILEVLASIRPDVEQALKSIEGTSLNPETVWERINEALKAIKTSGERDPGNIAIVQSEVVRLKLDLQVKIMDATAQMGSIFFTPPTRHEGPSINTYRPEKNKPKKPRGFYSKPHGFYATARSIVESLCAGKRVENAIDELLDIFAELNTQLPQRHKFTEFDLNSINTDDERILIALHRALCHFIEHHEILGDQIDQLEFLDFEMNLFHAEETEEPIRLSKIPQPSHKQKPPLPTFTETTIAFVKPTPPKPKKPKKQKKPKTPKPKPTPSPKPAPTPEPPPAPTIKEPEAPTQPISQHPEYRGWQVSQSGGTRAFIHEMKDLPPDQLTPGIDITKKNGGMLRGAFRTAMVSLPNSHPIHMEVFMNNREPHVRLSPTELTLGRWLYKLDQSAEDPRLIKLALFLIQKVEAEKQLLNDVTVNEIKAITGARNIAEAEKLAAELSKVRPFKLIPHQDKKNTFRFVYGRDRLEEAV